jgi:hypothetical protein
MGFGSFVDNLLKPPMNAYPTQRNAFSYNGNKKFGAAVNREKAWVYYRVPGHAFLA